MRDSMNTPLSVSFTYCNEQVRADELQRVIVYSIMKYEQVTFLASFVTTADALPTAVTFILGSVMC